MEKSRARLLLLSIPLIITFTTIGFITLFSTNYLTVSDLMKYSSPTKVSVIGNVTKGSVRYTNGVLTFLLTDGRNNVVVRYKGILQLDNSTSLAKITVIGVYYPKENVIEAQNILFKCPSKQEIEGYKYRLNQSES